MLKNVFTIGEVSKKDLESANCQLISNIVRNGDGFKAVKNNDDNRNAVEVYVVVNNGDKLSAKLESKSKLSCVAYYIANVEETELERLYNDVKACIGDEGNYDIYFN